VQLIAHLGGGDLRHDRRYPLLGGVRKRPLGQIGQASCATME
jgi:hypothetical protein